MMWAVNKINSGWAHITDQHGGVIIASIELTHAEKIVAEHNKTEWRDISTAPRDQNILVGAADRHYPAKGKRPAYTINAFVGEAEWGKSWTDTGPNHWIAPNTDQDEQGGCVDYDDPTHWMPLPDAPPAVEVATPVVAPPALTRLPDRFTDVHTEHCCTTHGCKYGDPDCTVVTGRAKQSFPCEYCDLQFP